MTKIAYYSIAGVILLGTALLSACSPRSQSLDATNWSLDTLRDEQGEMVDVLPGTVVTIDFQADTVSGQAGCNNYNGSYQVDGDNLTFSPLATTRMMCAEPLGVMQQENAYLQALEVVASYDISGSTLEMTDNRGDTLLTFIRAGQE
jgi:heat shock protein HslJ